MLGKTLSFDFLREKVPVRAGEGGFLRNGLEPRILEILKETPTCPPPYKSRGRKIGIV